MSAKDHDFLTTAMGDMSKQPADREVIAHLVDEKTGATEVIVAAADDRDPDLIPTEHDLATLRRIPAGMP